MTPTEAAPPPEPDEPPSFRPVGPYDDELLANVRPKGWENPEAKDRYHLVVIGAGTAGLVSAAGAAGLGARVALVERSLMGGDCLNVGCVPSKGLIEAARVWHRVTDGQRFGAPPHIGSGDFGRAMERMRRIRAEISPHDSAERFRGLGIDVFLGEGCFVDGKTVEVGGQRLRFRRAVIATGARAAELPIPGLRRAGYLTNETVFSLTRLPARLGVIGAGPIGCELAQAFARFGSRVTLFEQMDRVLPREDPEAAEIVQRALARDGVELALGSEIGEVRSAAGDKVIHWTHGGQTKETTVDEVLVSVGRRPNVDALGLDRAGVEFDRKGVRVDDRFRTTNRRVFACGDVASPLQFTHAADAQARAVLRNAFFFGRARSSDLTIPWCTYTSPEVAHVGVSPSQTSTELDTIRIDLAEVDRARLEGETEGFLKVYLARGSDRILGATIVAPGAGDLLGEVCLAMHQRIGLGAIADCVHPYPTTGEILKKAGDAYNRTRLTSTARRLFRIWFRIFR